jgi:hypothetical protein
MKLIVKKGTTSKILRIFVQDSSKTDGSGLTGLVHNTASLTAYYIREGAAAATAITLVNAVVGTFTSSGFKEVSAANMPGVYELHPPNACIASGADSVLIFMKGAANMAPLPIEIQLDDNTAKDIYDRVGSPAGASIAADLVVIDNFVDDLESRLTAARAGYIDNLSAGAVALQGTLSSHETSQSNSRSIISGNLDRAITTLESNIRGADSDDLKTLSDQIDTIPTSAGIADAVWDEDLTTHSTAKSAGWFVKKIKSITDVILAMVT